MSLVELQQWMHARVTHPAGVDPDGVGEWIVPSATLTAVERLEIYQRSYFARLLDCFRSSYPALLRALGTDLFNRFAIGYLNDSPPTSYTLAHLTDTFPQWLKKTRPDDGAGHWPDFIIELAEIELAVQQVYEGAGIEENAQTLDLTPEVVATPSLRLFAFHFPVHEYRITENTEAPRSRDCYVAVTRRDYRVTVTELPQDEFLALWTAVAKPPLSSAPEKAVTSSPHSKEIPPSWIQEWLQRGYVMRAPHSAP